MPIDLSQCWTWTGHVSKDGKRPVIVVQQKKRSANRFAWELYKGQIEPGFLARRTCQNFRCVNPEHLALVTRARNCAMTRANETPAMRAYLNNQKPTTWKFMKRRANGQFIGRAA